MSENANRPRADACFALAEQASELAGPARLVLVQLSGEPRVEPRARDCRVRWESGPALPLVVGRQD